MFSNCSWSSSKAHLDTWRFSLFGWPDFADAAFFRSFFSAIFTIQHVFIIFDLVRPLPHGFINTIAHDDRPNPSSQKSALGPLWGRKSIHNSIFMYIYSPSSSSRMKTHISSQKWQNVSTFRSLSFPAGFHRYRKSRPFWPGRYCWPCTFPLFLQPTNPPTS